MVEFIDTYRDEYGVEPICTMLPIAPSTYYRCKLHTAHPEQRSTRRINDEQMCIAITRVWQENRCVYGARKVWLALNREGIQVARCTVERLMRSLNMRGITRGQRKQITTVADKNLNVPPDLVNRQFVAQRPNQLWIADFTYVSTWSGFVYVAFVVDVYSRYIIGWRVLRNMQTDLVLDALEQALWARGKPHGVIHHSDRGSQYLSIRYTERLEQAGFNASVGTTGDSYDNAMAETIIGLYKTEVIHKLGPWKGFVDVEQETLAWVNWFNNRRLLAPIGNIPPAELEENYYRQLTINQAA